MFFNPKHHEHLDVEIASYIVSKFREVLGGTEVFVQHLPSILAACENPHSILTFMFNTTQEVWAMPQTNQMWLEFYLLENRVEDICHTITYSYRDEVGLELRHPDRTINKSFVMIEWERKGNFELLIKTITELVFAIGFDTIVEVNYEDVCKEFGVTIIDDSIEKQLNSRYNADVVLLKYFPERTHPFWNMEYDQNVRAFKKVDVIINGEECGGGAERSTDRYLQHSRFYSIENGEYSKTLFDKFGMERVQKELNKYLDLTFFERIGMGWGLSRLVKAVKNKMNKDNITVLL